MPGEPYIYGRSLYGRWWFWLVLGAIALLVLAVSGCAQDKVIVAGCPPVVAYPPEVQKQAAAELRAMPGWAHLASLSPSSTLRKEIDAELTAAGLPPLPQWSGPLMLPRFIDDYSRMRDQARACATP